MRMFLSLSLVAQASFCHYETVIYISCDENVDSINPWKEYFRSSPVQGQQNAKKYFFFGYIIFVKASIVNVASHVRP